MMIATAFAAMVLTAKKRFPWADLNGAAASRVGTALREMLLRPIPVGPWRQVLRRLLRILLGNNHLAMEAQLQFMSPNLKIPVQRRSSTIAAGRLRWRIF